MIKLVKLELFNYRSFKGLHSVNFPENGLLLVRGIADDSESTSGVGKSNILSAIAYILDYGSVPATKLQNWFSEDSFWVRLELKIDNDSVSITRGPTKNKLSINGTDIKGGKSVIEEKFRNLIGIDSKLLEVLTYRQQRTRSLFFSKTDSKKKDFLSDILELGSLEEALDQSNGNIKALELTLRGLESSLELVQDDLSKLVEPPLFNIPETFELQKSRLEELDIRFGEVILLITAGREKRQKLKEKIDIKRAEICLISAIEKEKYNSGDIINKIEILSKEKADLHIQRAETEEKIQSFSRSLERIEDFRTELAATSELIKTLNKSLCFTCEREWKDAKAAKKIEEFTAKKSMLEKSVSKENELKSQLSILDIEFRCQKDKLNTINEKIAELTVDRKNKLLEIENKQLKSLSEIPEQKFTERMAALVDSLLKREKAIDQEMVQIEEEEKSINIEKAKYDKDVEYFNNRTFELTSRQKIIKQKIEESSKQIAQERDFIDLVGKSGFLGSIFEEVLNDISFKISEILKSVPNVSNCTIQFQSSTETEKGDIRSKITPVVYRDGIETIPDLLSGGQLSSLELATDLAVASVIQSRTGKLPCWLVEDEAFEGLPSIDKESCLELLKKEAKDKLILVVDHSTEVKEFFDQVIDVKLIDGKHSVIMENKNG